MKIVVDARTVFAKARRGTGKNLVDLYAQIESLRPNWDISFYYSKGFDAYGQDLDFKRIKLLPLVDVGNRFNLWQDYLLPLKAKLAGADVLHSPAQTSPAFIPCSTIVTIHDIIPLRMNDGMDEQERLKLENNIRHSLEKAAVVITVSQYSKNDLLDYFGDQYADKIKVVHWAPEGKLLSGVTQAASCAVLSEYKLQNGTPLLSKESNRAPFFFTLGAASPRKNTEKLLHAFKAFCLKNTDWNLLIGGIQQGAMSKFATIIDDLGISDRVSLNGFLPEEHMPSLYAQCDAFIFPSLYEGFGLPVLDAFASNSPLLLSNVTSLPEVAGDAAVYFDPNSNEEMTAGMLKLADSAQLREELVALGNARLQHFTWHKVATQVIAIIEQVKQ